MSEVRARLRHLPVTLAVCGGGALVGAVVAGLVGGGVAAAGVAIGVGVVVASYALSTLAVAWADSVDPKLVLPVGMAAYVTKFSVLGVVLVVLLDSGWDGVVPLGIGIAAGVVAWTATQIWWVSGPGRPSP